MKFIYFSLPGYGHINPTLNVARELVTQGHEVIYYATPEFKSYVESTGATFRDYQYNARLDGNMTRDLGMLLNHSSTFVSKRFSSYLQSIIQEQPDCIMHDSLAVWGKIIAHKLHIPAVCMITTQAYNKKTVFGNSPLLRSLIKSLFFRGPYFLKAYVIYQAVAFKNASFFLGPGELIMSKEKLNIVFSLPLFQIGANTFPASFQFVGPSIYQRPQHDEFIKNLPKNKKIIYVSYGTVVNDDLSFFQKCIDAFKDTPYYVIISLGNRFDPADLPHPPKNIIIKKYVNQLMILEKASLFITHGGMNSITESLYYGVPMIVIPDTDEQRFNSFRVTQINAGVTLAKKDLTAKLLLMTTEKILKTTTFAKDCATIKKSFQKAGGYKEAVQKIFTYLQATVS